MSASPELPNVRPEDLPIRLAGLRDALRKHELDAFIVPHTDAFQSEYLPPGEQRLAWLTGFTGSAGAAVVGRDAAALFVDGRYTLQARNETPEALYTHCHLIDCPPAVWLADNLPRGSRVGFDPWLHSVAWLEKARGILDKHGIALVPLAQNPVEALWLDRPAPPASPVVVHEAVYAGRAAADKWQEVTALLRREGLDAVVMTQPDSVAWLLNIRGDDIPCTPVALGFAIVHAHGPMELFIDPARCDRAVMTALDFGVTVRTPAAFADALEGLGKAGRRVQIDPVWTVAAIAETLHRHGARIEHGGDPCTLPKACKNTAELTGARNAHRRDAVAMIRFLRWLEQAVPQGGVTEMSAAAALGQLRAEGELYVGPSFETISGCGPNGAIVHYRVSPETDRPLVAGTLYLVDSGGQYRDGTTDITRTVALGAPTAAMRRHYTLVLKGNIALAGQRFPRGTTGSQLDVLARAPLWRAGIDYDHGTGHGVGSFLSVHEGPQRISKMPNAVALQPGMVLSNEPGFYLSGSYGIRIENLLAVAESLAHDEHEEQAMLEFEVLTLVPFDRSLIEIECLTAQDVAWIDAYYARIAAEIGPRLDGEDAVWLAAATCPLHAAGA